MQLMHDCSTIYVITLLKALLSDTKSAEVGRNECCFLQANDCQHRQFYCKFGLRFQTTPRKEAFDQPQSLPFTSGSDEWFES